MGCAGPRPLADNRKTTYVRSSFPRPSRLHQGIETPDSYFLVRVTMEAESCNVVPSQVRVKATFRLGSESYCVEAGKGSCLSEELVSMKEESMMILKDFITKHNVAQDVPDELVEESSSEDETEKPQVKSKKTKLT